MMFIAYASAALWTLLGSCADRAVTLDEGRVAVVASAQAEAAPWQIDAPSPELPELEIEPEPETSDPMARLAVLCALTGRCYARSSQPRPREADTPRSTGAHAPVRSPRGPPR